MMEKGTLELDINPPRLNYLLDLYKMSKNDLAVRISGKRKKLSSKDLDALLEKGKMPIMLMKKIDKIFEKGLNWYATNRVLPESKSSSIFFRKDKFNSEMNFESKKITSKFEDRKFEIQTLCSSINLSLERKLEPFSLETDARTAAKKVKTQFDTLERKLIDRRVLKKSDSDLDELKKYIALIEGMNVFVFEFLENWNKVEKANFNGFFMYPNVIVIKGQKHRRREIFSLLHEFAHYLLNMEEIDDVEENQMHEKQSRIEKWCNDFVYYLLIGEYEKTIDQLSNATEKNNFHAETINEIYGKIPLSRGALYTRLRISGKISQADYNDRVRFINEAINRERDEEKTRLAHKKAMLKAQGKDVSGFAPKKLQSNLFREIVKMNYFDGNMDEPQLCNYLHIRPDRLDKELY